MNKVISKLNLKNNIVAIIPYIIGASLFIITPIFLLISKSINNEHHDIVMESMKQQKIGSIMFHSIWLGLVAAFISVLIGLPFGYFVARSKNMVFKVTTLALIISPLFVFTISRIFSLRILLINMYDDTQAIKNNFSMILGMLYLYMPFAIIPIYSILTNMPSSLIDASNDLGYNQVQTLYKVVVPYAMKGIFSALAIVFMLSATSLVISHSLLNTSTGSSNYALIGNKIDTLAKEMTLDTPKAAMGSLLSLITIIVMMSIYGIIYAIPFVINKIRGNFNV